MNNKSKMEDTVTYLCEFSDKKLEREFFSQEIDKAIKYIKPIVLSLGILYLLFIIPDYFLQKSISNFNYVLLNRLFFLILIILFYFRTLKLKDSYTLINWITVYEIIVSLLFLSVFYLYKNPNFIIQAFGVMVIILGFFLIPNRWINMIIVAIFISISFLTLSLIHIKNIMINELSAAIVYLIIVIALCSISSYRINYLKRMQYLNSKKLMKLATLDPLTGIYNRYKFDKELDKCIDYAHNFASDLSLTIFDLDDFKIINDNYGHLVGDKVIIDMVNLVRSKTRGSEIFARWGGEEFVILFMDMKEDEVINHIEEIRSVIADYIFGEVGNVTCSFGVVMLRSGEDAKSLLHRADLRLYEAKQEGKNKIKS